MRLDGHSFSKWTIGFLKPFDSRLHDTFALTCEDLLRYFNSASAIYTQSDEITVLFPHGTHMFGGRIQKIASIAAGYTSARFNHHLSTVPDVPPGKVGTAHFDCLIFSVPSTDELLNNVMWRCRTDCRRNSKFQFARQFFSAKELHGLTSDQMTQMVSSQAGCEYETSVPDWAKNGATFTHPLSADAKSRGYQPATFKKYIVVLPQVSPKTGEQSVRTRIEQYHNAHLTFCTTLRDWLVAKYSNRDDNPRDSEGGVEQCEREKVA